MIFNSIILFYLTSLTFLLFYTLYFIISRITPSQNQALTILWASRFVWTFTFFVGAIIWLLAMFSSGAPGTKQSDMIWFMLLLIFSSYLLPTYTISNMNDSYRLADYNKLLLNALLPFVGILVFVSFTLIKFY